MLPGGQVPALASPVLHSVLLDAAGRAFLADFGLSKPMKDMSKMYTNTLGGTYWYM